MVSKGLSLIAVVSAGLVVAGVSWIYPPAGLICAGFLLAAVGALFLVEV